MNHTDRKSVLLINASARGAASNSRSVAQDLVAQLRAVHGDIRLRERDLSETLPLIDEAWVGANFTPAEQRTPAQRDKLALSDALIAELRAADIVVIAAPMYNFGIPAGLKAWVDQIARAGVTFRYTQDGPVGLLEGKQAYVVITTGGTEIGSAIDFSSGYLRHILGFVGIQDVRILAAERHDARDAEKQAALRERISDIVVEDSEGERAVA